MCVRENSPKQPYKIQYLHLTCNLSRLNARERIEAMSHPQDLMRTQEKTMGRARFCKTTFTKQQICTNPRLAHSNWKSKILDKDLHCNIESLQELIRSIQTCPVPRNERPPLQHASQLPLGTPSEHFSASSRCHTSQSGCVGPKGV